MDQGPSTEDVRDIEARARRLESERRFDEARASYDAALRLDPASQFSAEGRARVALQLQESSAVEHCARALAFHDAFPERQLRMIQTAAAELGSAIEPLLLQYIDRHPGDAPAHEMLSELRAEWGAAESFAETYEDALDRFPTSKPLLRSYWNTLTRAGRIDDALQSIDEHRGLVSSDRDLTLLEVQIANHGGRTQHAAELVGRLDDRADAKLALGQHLLQTHRAADAAELLESVVRAQPGNLTAWSLLELAWRSIRSPHHRWLIGDPQLFGAQQLDLSASDLETIAGALRKLHRTRSQPIGQSVRGGTQTAGQLFAREDPELVLLTNSLARSIRDFVGKLPGADAKHPLLKHRDMGLAFGPSWSVRLSGGGYHAAHFHPNGIISSACYIALPDPLADDHEKPGWLEIGRPPPEMKLELEPLASFEPREGRLVLFSSFLFHGTRPFAQGERLTVAFDLVPVPGTGR